MIATAALLGMTALFSTGIARADVAYVTAGSSIYTWNTTTNVVALLTTAIGGLDSLVFDGNGNIVYSIIGTNQLGLYNSITHANSIIANVGAGAADMALDPGGNSVLVSNAFSTTIQRVNLTTHAVTTFNMGTRPDGLAYDAAGHLFAVLGRNEVAQLDPTTLAVIKTISTNANTDGLAYDTATGKLYASYDVASGGFYTLDTALTTATLTTLGVDIDGLAASGSNVFLVRRNVGGLVYDLNTASLSVTSPGIAGADDIAPLSGLGSPTVPEPASFVLLGTLLVGLGMATRRRKA